MMKAIRIFAIILATSVIVGELWRSWGAGRPFVFVIDDVIFGGILMAGAIGMYKDTIRRRALFASGWGMAVGTLYMSFFTKVVAGETTNAGNWNLETLTALIGFVFVSAILGLLGTLLLPLQQTETD